MADTLLCGLVLGVFFIAIYWTYTRPVMMASTAVQKVPTKIVRTR